MAAKWLGEAVWCARAHAECQPPLQLKFPSANAKDDTAPDESMAGERELFADEALDILRRYPILKPSAE